MASLEQRVAEALPCEHVGHSSCCERTPRRDCPCYYRPAVLALLREVVEECATVAEEGERLRNYFQRIATLAGTDSNFEVIASIDIASRIRALASPTRDPLDRTPT